MGLYHTVVIIEAYAVQLSSPAFLLELPPTVFLVVTLFAVPHQIHLTGTMLVKFSPIFLYATNLTRPHRNPPKRIPKRKYTQSYGTPPGNPTLL